MNCQIMCPNRPESLTVVTRVSDSSTKKALENINDVSHLLDINSCSDVIGVNSISQLAHTLQLNNWMMFTG